MTRDLLIGARFNAALLASALILGACGSDPATPKASKDNATADDGTDEGADEPKKDAGKASSAKLDGGKATSTKPDARVSTTPPDDGNAPADTKAPDAGNGGASTGSDGGVHRDGGQSTSAQSDGGGGGSKEHADLGKGDGSDVITIGDSWMNYFVNGGGIERGLLEASGQKYRTYGVAGTKLLDEVIPNQYESAKRENPKIKTVVMTAGGNDILLGTNPVADPKAVIDMEPARLEKLWNEMAADGVEDVIYIEYSQGGSADDAANVQYGIEKVGPACTNLTSLRCHYMLSDPIIMKMLIDGIHPTMDGCTKLGKAAFDLMVSEGMRR